jgi:hypothetical protein
VGEQKELIGMAVVLDQAKQVMTKISQPKDVSSEIEGGIGVVKVVSKC